MQTMKRKLNKRNLVLLLSLALLLTATVGATLAYVITKTDLLTNLFLPSKVDCAVEKSGDAYTVKNTGDTDAYVRIAVVATWKGTDDTVYAQAPILGADYTLELDSRWVAGSDGFYYYEKALLPGESVTILAQATRLETEKAGYELRLQLLTTSIQADPIDAVHAAWPAVEVVEVEGKGSMLTERISTP